MTYYAIANGIVFARDDAGHLREWDSLEDCEWWCEGTEYVPGKLEPWAKPISELFPWCAPPREEDR